MLLLMPSPTLIGNRWYLRIRVPRDLLEQANGTAITLPVNGEMRTVTVKEAVKLALDTSDRNAAKARFTEAHGALLAHWERLRNIAAGSSAELSHRQIHGLIGRWYDWFIQEHEKSDEPAETWEHHLDRLADTAEKHETREGEERSPRHAASVRAAIQELSRLPSFLAEAGIGLSQVTHERLVDEMEPDLTVAFQLLQRRARGDYRPDTHRERFPTSTPLPELNATAKTNHRPDISLTFAAVIDEQVKRRSAGKGAKPMDEKTIQKFRLGADEFAAFRGSDDVTTVTAREADAWVQDMLEAGELSNNTIGQRLQNLRTVVGWARKQSLGELFPSENPLAIVERPAFRPVSSVDRTYRIAEGRTVLLAARKETAPELRWLPWICAYSGARINELAQLTKADFFQLGTDWFFRLTTAGGKKLKTDASERTVPIHPELIKEGLLSFIENLNCQATARIFPTRTQLNIGEWVREKVGVTRKELAPNHGWRHLFEDLCRNSGVSDAAATYITGRVTGKSSDGYGKTQVMLPGLAAEMRKIPVFPVETNKDA